MIFDAADPRECYRRQPSIRPHQALALVNSSLSLAQSRSLAGQISRNQAAITAAEPGGKIDDAAFVVTAFEILLSREPSELELQACRQFLVRQSRQLADPASLELLGTGEELVPPSLDPAERARENLVLVLMNHNDFLTIR